MRIATLGLICLLLAVTSVRAEESPESLLEAATDIKRHALEREFAAKRLLECGKPAHAVLLKALDHKESIYRQVAASLLGKAGVLEAEAPLLRLADGKDFFAAQHAARALTNLYTQLPVEELAKRLRPEGSDAPTRLSAALHAVDQKTAASKKPLPTVLENAVLPLLSHKMTSLRQAAAIALRHSRAPVVARALLARVSLELKPTVLTALCHAIGEIRPDENGDAIAPLIKHPDQRVGIEAAFAMQGLGYEDVRQTFEHFARRATGSARIRALELLATLKDPLSADTLKEACADEAWQVRLAAINAIGALGNPGITGRLQPMLKDPAPRVRSRVAVLMDQAGIAGAIWPMIEDLRGDEMKYRIEAARTLGELKTKHGIRSLLDAMQDENLTLACTAAHALGAIGDPSTVNPLLAILRGKRPALADAARMALTKITGRDPGTTRASQEAWLKKISTPKK